MIDSDGWHVVAHDINFRSTKYTQDRLPIKLRGNCDFKDHVLFVVG